MFNGMGRVCLICEAIVPRAVIIVLYGNSSLRVLSHVKFALLPLALVFLTFLAGSGIVPVSRHCLVTSGKSVFERKKKQHKQNKKLLKRQEKIRRRQQTYIHQTNKYLPYILPLDAYYYTNILPYHPTNIITY